MDESLDLVFLPNYDKFKSEECQPRDLNGSQVKTVVNSLHAYWQIAHNRLLDQTHMFLTYQFVIQFSQNITNKIDETYAPFSSTPESEQTRGMMEEDANIVSKRYTLNFAIERIQESLKDLERVQLERFRRTRF